MSACVQTGLVIPQWVTSRLADLPRDFTGRIELNLFRGGVANVNITESVKPQGRPND